MGMRRFGVYVVRRTLDFFIELAVVDISNFFGVEYCISS